MEDYEGIEEGIEEGIAEGIEEGTVDEKMEKVNEFIATMPSPTMRQLAWLESEETPGSIIFNGKRKRK